MCQYLLVAGLLVLGLNLAAFAQEAPNTVEAPEPPTGPELPDLLTLEQALTLASQAHPSLLSAKAQQSAASASVLVAGADRHWRASLGLQGRLADRANDDDSDYFNDSRYELKISKLLSDFGQSAAQATAAQLNVDSSTLNLQYAERLRRVEVIARYLDVVAADFKFAADNEEMTLAFFPWNRARERREAWDSESELTVMKLRSAYNLVLSKRNQAEQQQRKSRFLLASAMGWPDAKPVLVTEPDLTAYARATPDYDELLTKVFDQSPVLARLQLERDALMARTDGARQRIRPRLSLNLYASNFEHYYTSKDDSRAVLNLEIPILDGGRQKTEIAQIGAQQLAKEAEISRYEFQLRDQLINWVQRLEFLEVALADYEVELAYRERALDKARLLYEMEVKARIGQAMGDMAKTLYEGATLRFERAVIWEQIDAMLGTTPLEIKS